MGIFDKKSRTTTNVDEQTINNVDNRAAQGEDVDIGGNVSINLGDISTNNRGLGAGAGSGGALGDINVTTSDLGAIDAASGISDNAFALTSQVANQLGAITSGAIDSAESISERASDLASEATRDEAARTQQMLIVAGVVVVVGLAYFSRRRK